MKKPLLNAHSLFFTFFLIALFSLSSCEKDEVIVPENSGTAPECQISNLITKSSDAEEPYDSRVYQYDSQNRLSKWTSTYKGIEKAEGTYEYNPQGQLIKLTIKDKYLNNGEFTIDVTDIITFEYNEKGQVIKYVQERPTPQSGQYSRATSETTWEYDSEGNRIKSTRTSPDYSTPYVNLFTYQGGNLIKAVFNIDSPSEHVEEYEYYLDRENKERPFQDLTNLTRATPNNNMIKKMVYNSTHSDIDGTHEISYEYNDKGFATKVNTVTTTPQYNYTTINVVEYNCL